MKEIYKDKELDKLIKETVTELVETVCHTYGPNGHTVIITEDEGPYATKDGVSVSKSIFFKDPIKNKIATILKQVAQKTVDEAGDGTTTSMCLAGIFLNRGYELIEEGYKYNEVKRELEELVEDTLIHLKKNSKKLKEKDIIHVANISSNNDQKIANLISDAFKHSKLVKVEEGDSYEDSISKIKGMTILSPYFNSAFINNESKKSIEYENAEVIVIDGKLENLNCIKGLLTNKPMIILADHFSEGVISLLKHNYNKGSLQVAPIKTPGLGEHRKSLVNDICIYTNSKLINPSKTYIDKKYVGFIDGVTCKNDSTTLFNKKAEKYTTDIIKELESYLKSDITKREVELTLSRLEGLKGMVSIIKVGGNSPIEMKERYDRVEDAVRAVSCALEEGIVEGGGMAYVRASLNQTNNKFENCLLDPYRKIHWDNNIDGIVTIDIGKNMYKENIIDPLKVTRCSLENAASVAKMLLGTKALVLNPETWS